MNKRDFTILFLLYPFYAHIFFYVTNSLYIMKKLSLVVVLFSFLFVACADKKPKAEKIEVKTEMEVQEVETNVVDSLATELEKTKEELEKASKEVDQLLEEL